MDGPVYTLVVHSQYLYVGGAFTSTADHAIKNFNHFALYAGRWTNVSPRDGLNGPVGAIGFRGDFPYVGGNFSQTTDGSLQDINNLVIFFVRDWLTVPNQGLKLSDPGTISAITEYNYDLYVGGEISGTADGSVTSSKNIIELDFP